jgi:hypothetical protein
MFARTAVAAVGCVVVIAGCGSSSPASTSRSSRSTTSTSTQSALGKSPKQLVADASIALRQAHGFTVQGSIVQGAHRVELKIAETSATTIRLSIVAGKTSEQLVRVPGGSYFRANRTFWAVHRSPQAAQLANRWIELPMATSRSFTASLGALAPDTLARCLTEDHGTLSIAGTTTIEHRRAIVVKDAGNAPGSAPGTLAIAATGPPYPLALRVTGGQRAGGRIDVCNQGKATKETGMLTLEQFGHVPTITAPTNPLTLAQPPTV